MQPDFESLFPFLKQGVAWLDNAATTQKPLPVLECMDAVYAAGVASPRRGIHRLGNASTQIFEDSRRVVAEFLGGAGAAPEEVVFTKGTTESINMVASGFVKPRLKPGDRIVVSVLEHHSNFIPWMQVAQAASAVLEVIPLTPDGVLDMAAYEAILQKGDVRFVALAWVSNVLGSIQPVGEAVRLAHRAGAAVLIDGAQGVPHVPPDVAGWDCDFFAFSGHKVFGPGGTGVLWGRRALLEQMEPFLYGGEMVGSLNEREVFSWAEVPHRFEGGTPHVAGVAGMAGALEWLRGLPHAARQKEVECLTLFLDELQRIPSVRILGPIEKRIPLVSFVMDGIHPHDVAQILDEEGVAVRSGHMCAQPLLQHMGLTAAVRVSFAPYNTEGDVRRCVNGLRRARELFS